MTEYLPECAVDSVLLSVPASVSLIYSRCFSFISSPLHIFIFLTKAPARSLPSASTASRGDEANMARCNVIATSDEGRRRKRIQDSRSIAEVQCALRLQLKTNGNPERRTLQAKQPILLTPKGPEKTWLPLLELSWDLRFFRIILQNSLMLCSKQVKSGWSSFWIPW